ncbi:AAA family ATPase [Thermoleptolyngbya sp. M55_K2018_002]|uniref:AAA family ATPase n=1 Tax=Thermoleptolyngbya sp. M55_K2018_002 TaxID=2747808 RepID=UPI001A0D0C6D|nr:AAA family ATPase [Thermoleptolyngbya sp. M55_K2018_002]HIK42023.1 AAA family ATPase [Thermoleptolyngbya sp. M55_K2018_002]
MHRFQRIAIVGTSGTGKTTLAQQVGRQLGIAHIELDALHWEPNWTAAPSEVFRARVAEALAGDCWVADGNYSSVRDLVWGRADTIVWLDYSFGLVLWRSLRRAIWRSTSDVELWSGNRETWRQTFFSRDSILLWVLQTYHRRRREYPLLLSQPEYAHLSVVRVRSPQETRSWLIGLTGDGVIGGGLQ